MPGRYYTKVFEKKGTAIRFVMIDTAPLIDKYRNESETYPDACKQDMDQQLAWIDSVLTVAKEDWVVVIGHHPIYAETSKDEMCIRDRHCTHFYIRANRCSSLYDDLFSLRGWKTEMCIRDRVGRFGCELPASHFPT